MSTTRITRIGNSKGIVIPADIIKALRLDEGDEVELDYNPNTESLTFTFTKTKQLKLA